MDDDFRAAFARALRGRVGRAVIDHEHVIELGAHPLGDTADVHLLVIGGDDGGDVVAIERPAWLRRAALHA